jgi:energy-coupling factor transporter ATP-binding protein EcfA2
MLTHLKLDNFKIWKSTGPVRLAPVTLLLGTNSSGKSSLIQSLLLIRQTVMSSDPNQDLNLGNPDSGDTIALGQFLDVLCQHGDSSRVGIEFRWSAKGDNKDAAIFSAKYIKGPSGSGTLKQLRLGRKELGFTVTKIPNETVYRLQLSWERKSRGQSAAFRPERSFAFSAEALAQLGEAGDRIRDVGPRLLTELGRIIYLGPVRKLAQRDYAWSGRMPSTIGDDGSRAVVALIASGVAARRAKRRGLSLPNEAQLIARTAYWLKQMDLADELEVRALGNSSRYELLIKREGELTNLRDVGVGVSQVLPVVVAALSAAPGHIVIVEEPESHLHPLAESLLAELFAKVSADRGVQFILETHSEHLFRRMQTLMAKQQVTRDQVAMYFIERDGPGAKLRELVPNEFGAITNWPERFFGDAIGETREQAMARAERELAKVKGSDAGG